MQSKIKNKLKHDEKHTSLCTKYSEIVIPKYSLAYTINKDDGVEDVRILLRDCLDELSRIRLRSARLVVTSPPHKIAKLHEEKLEGCDYG